MPPSKNISFEELSKYFHLPINQVAKELGVCATILKKICRRNGIPRWPHRKIKSLDKMIANLEMNLTKNPQEKEEITREIETLKAKRIEILKNPDILSKGPHSDDPLKIASVKMNRTKGQLGHRSSKVDDDFSDDEPNCFVPANEGRFSMTHTGPAFNGITNFSSFNTNPPATSYVDMIFNSHAPFNQVPTLNIQQPLVNKPQLINTLANMKFDVNAPLRKNPSMDLASYSYDLSQQQSHVQFTTKAPGSPPVQNNQANQGAPASSASPLPSFAYLPQETYALPSIRMIDSNTNRVPTSIFNFKEDVSNTPSIPYLEAQSQSMQPFSMSNSTNSSSTFPSWFDEEKSRYLGKSQT